MLALQGWKRCCCGSVCVCVCAGWWKEKSSQPLHCNWKDKTNLIQSTVLLYFYGWYIINTFPLTAKAIVKFHTGISIFFWENLFYKSIYIFWNNYLNVQFHISGGEIFLWNCQQPKRHQKNWEDTAFFASQKWQETTFYISNHGYLTFCVTF